MARSMAVLGFPYPLALGVVIPSVPAVAVFRIVCHERASRDVTSPVALVKP
jgi:hypothetical protein